MKTSLLAFALALLPATLAAAPLPPALDACVVAADLCVTAIDDVACDVELGHLACFEVFETCAQSFPEFGEDPPHCRIEFAKCRTGEIFDPPYCYKVELNCPSFGDS